LDLGTYTLKPLDIASFTLSSGEYFPIPKTSISGSDLIKLVILLPMEP